MFGEEIFLKNSEAVKLATLEQVQELKHLIGVLNIDPKIIDKWLAASKSVELDEMKETQIIKCIDSLKAKLNVNTKSEVDLRAMMDSSRIVDQEKLKNLSPVISSEELILNINAKADLDGSY